jgi:hypothetical protein
MNLMTCFTRHSTLLMTALFATSMTPFALSQQKAATPAGFELKRGVNLSHWLSQNFGWSPKPTFITEKDIEFIAGAGCRSIAGNSGACPTWTGPSG